MRQALIALVLGLAMTGCSSGGPTPASHLSSTPHPSASPTRLITPTADPRTPLGAGQRAWAAYSERGLPQAQWWAQLKPLLSAGAAATYVYTDPRNLPPMKVTGPIRVAAKAPDQPKFTVEVVVPTDKGAFRLDLERHTLKSPWLLYAIKFPQGVH